MVKLSPRLSGEATCIDCHKGIAHELPDMEGVDPGWKVPPELQGDELPEASVLDRLERLAHSPHRTMWSLDEELSAMSMDSIASARGGTSSAGAAAE